MVDIQSEKDIQQLTDLFSAIAHPTRAQMLLLIKDVERRSGDIAEYLQMSPSAVSHQLSWLREKNIVSTRRVGREIYYVLADECIRRLVEIALKHIHEDYQSE